MKILIITILAMVTCLCFYLLKGEQKKLKTIIWISYVSVFAIAFYLALDNLVRIIIDPPMWDFPSFFINGKVGSAGYDFYLPASFQTIYNSLHLPFSDPVVLDPFVKEVVNVGFPYPPPTMLYFVPLGFFSFKTAFILWIIFITLFLLISIYIVYTQFFKKYKLNGLMLVTILFLLFSPVRTTLFYTQTNFILLFILLLMKKYEGTKYAGIFLTLAIFTKPYMIIFVLALILRKNWNAIVYFILSSVSLVGVTAVVFGIAPFMSYLLNNPGNRLPEIVFSAANNQSLQAVLIRAGIIPFGGSFIYAYIAAGVLLITGLYLLFLQKRKLYDYIWAVLLMVGLMLYPATLDHYGVLLLFIIFQFFDKKNPLGFDAYLNIPIIGLVYCLSTYSVFASIWFLLLIIILKSLGVFSENRFPASQKKINTLLKLLKTIKLW